MVGNEQNCLMRRSLRNFEAEPSVVVDGLGELVDEETCRGFQHCCGL